MTAPQSSAVLQLDPPGPGPWKRDNIHFPRPVTRYWVDMHGEAFEKGTSDFASFYGMLIGGLNCAYPGGFAYNQLFPAPEAEIPQRFQRAAEAMAGKVWREQLKEWDETSKPNAIAAHRAIQAIDPDALSDTDLAAYLGRCRDHHAAMITQHMRYTASAVVPVGDFLAHAGPWTGLPPGELLGLMRGSARVSAGGSDELERMIAAIRKDPAAMNLLQSTDDPAQVLAALRNVGGEAGQAAADYLDLVGNRLLDGFDISEPTALEMPDALLRAIRVAAAGVPETATDVDARIAETRAKVPAEHQAMFDELLGEARLMYRLRDERGIYSDIWASGLMRRAALGAGRRLVQKGKLPRPELAVDATVGELQALLAGTGGPSADELAKRAQYRADNTGKQTPITLGPPEPPPPDLAGLPPPVARLMGATMISLGMVFGSSEVENKEDVLYGLAVSSGVYEGPARRVSGPAEFSRIVRGDILVTEATTEAFNILLPLLGGIVTDNGGLLSHSAIVAREYGIPGVVGTREATQRIPDGARIRVDGDAGEVTVLG